MKFSLVRRVACFFACCWVALVPPGLSYYWLIDPNVHAQIDADLYGQAPDGRTLPDHPERPPHEHPASAATSVSVISLASVFDVAFYQNVFSLAHRPSLQGERVEAEVIAESIALSPLDPPPRA